MKAKFPDGTVIVGGYVPKDSEKGTNEKSPYKFSVKVGELPPKDGEEKPTPSWCSCASWHNSAAGIKKGDTVLAWGKLESREYENKTYWTLNCDGFVFANKLMVGSVPTPVTSTPLPNDFEEIISDDELPF